MTSELRIAEGFLVCLEKSWFCWVKLPEVLVVVVEYLVAQVDLEIVDKNTFLNDTILNAVYFTVTIN